MSRRDPFRARETRPMSLGNLTKDDSPEPPEVMTDFWTAAYGALE